MQPDIPLHTLYTIGYSGQTLEGLRARLDELSAVLVDIRFNPRSRVNHWRGSQLKEYFGDRYAALPCLGNENYKGGRIKLSNPALAIAPMRITLQRRSAILLCECWDVSQCHRKKAAAFLQKHLGVQVIHLPPPARALLTKNQIDVVQAMKDGWTLHYHDGYTQYRLTRTIFAPLGGWISDRTHKRVLDVTVRSLESKGVIVKNTAQSYDLTDLGNTLQV
jgi:hypothetical protein